MATLKNTRHELFAQSVAQGSSAAEAYRQAGFKTTTPNSAEASACRLLRDAKVAARIDELRAETAAVCGFTRRTIVGNHQRVFEAALQAGQLTTAMDAIDKIAGYCGIWPLSADIDRDEVPAVHNTKLSIAERIAANQGALSVLKGVGH